MHYSMYKSTHMDVHVASYNYIMYTGKAIMECLVFEN